MDEKFKSCSKAHNDTEPKIEDATDNTSNEEKILLRGIFLPFLLIVNFSIN